MDRRQFVVGTAAAALAAGSVHAEDGYPTRPITLINPFPPGGAADVVGRPFAAVLEPLLKQAVVIETKAGAAGQVGAQYAASAKPDGSFISSRCLASRRWTSCSAVRRNSPAPISSRSPASPKARWRSWSMTRRRTRP